MAIRNLRCLGFIRPFRYRVSAFSQSTHASQAFDPFPAPHCSSQTQTKPKPSISEQFVLNQLADLLPIDPEIANASNAPPRSAMEAGPSSSPPPEPDGIAPPDLISAVDKLRGIFLQKPLGKSALELALSATGVVLTPDTFAGVVNRGNLGGAAMVSFFDWAIKQPGLPRCTETYNVIMKALGRRRFFEFMEGVLLRMKKEGVPLDSKTVAIALDCYVSGRRVRKALEMFERLEKIGCARDVESLSSLLHSLCRWSHVKLANALFKKMKGEMRFDTSTYNEMIGGWSKLGRVEEVERLLAEMVASGLKPDTHTFSHLIKSLGKSDRIDDAIDAFETMEGKGCRPDNIAYGAIMSLFISAGDLDKAIGYYKRMVEGNCLPDAETYSKLLGGLLNVRRVADALEIFDEMLDRGICPSTGMVTSLVEPLCSYGPPHAAMLIYKKAKKAGSQLSRKAYKLLLMRLAKFDKCGMLLRIWEEMQQDGHPSDVEVYEYIIDGLCNAWQLDNAVLVAEESLQNGFCIGGVVCSKLANRLLEKNKVEIAYKLHLKVREARKCANMQRIWRYKGWHF